MGFGIRRHHGPRRPMRAGGPQQRGVGLLVLRPLAARILVALSEKYKLPVHFIGGGEGIDDLAPFTARDFARAIAGQDN